MTVNPNTGKRERILVDLATLYPTPDVQGSELSFEEIWARNRGWLDHSWEESSADENAPFDENSPDAFAAGHGAGVDALSKGVSEKLVIHRDPEPAMYDENGAVQQAPRGGKPKKIRRMEVNETQTSKPPIKCLSLGVNASLMRPYSQGKA